MIAASAVRIGKERHVGVEGRRADGALVWSRDGRDWPNRDSSRFVEVGDLVWHVQIMGRGPVILLLHGIGSSTHSWRGLAPLLAQSFTVVAPDLPGHAFTRGQTPDRMSLPGMATSCAALTRALGMTPRVAVGHSAGAAVIVKMILDGSIAPAGLIALNGALVPIGGTAGRVFAPLANLLAQSSLLPRLFSWRAHDKGVIGRLIKRTGSTIDDEGLELYGRLAGNPIHAAAALTMMARWDLWTLEKDLRDLKTPLVLVVGGNDGTIAPTDAFKIRDVLPGTSVEYLRGLGHLAHEERPGMIADLITRYARQWSVSASSETRDSPDDYAEGLGAYQTPSSGGRV